MKLKYWIITWIFVAIAGIHAFSQSVGVYAGPDFSRFFNISTDDNYVAHYNTKPGFSIMGFYETQIDSHFVRLEIGYHQLNANFDILNIDGNASFYRNLDLKDHLLAINILGKENIYTSKKFSADICFGPTLGIQIKNHTRGNGWNNSYYTELDSNNNSVSILGIKNYSINEYNSKELAKVLVGVKVGYDLQTTLTTRCDLFLNNSFGINFSNILKYPDLKYTSLWTISAGIGLRYRL